MHRAMAFSLDKAGYEKRRFEAPARGGPPIVHDVYERGDGPPVVIIQELPGIGRATLRLADRLEDAGLGIVLPHLFGPLGRVDLLRNTARVFCMRREFSLFARNESSPLVDWLRALCQDVATRSGVEGVGVIGMCLTGNFAMTLIADQSVSAAVASQPSVPLIPRDALHMSDEEIQETRAALDEKGTMLALRFEGDPMCSRARFEAIREAFNDDAERVELIELPGRGHAVLTLDFVDREGHPTRQALERVIGHLVERLEPARRTRSGM